MPNDFVFSCYLIILLVCADRGDGRWKNTNRKALQRDIEIFEKMAEHIESEIDEYYEEYEEPELKENISNRLHYKHLTNILNTKISDQKSKHQSRIFQQDKITNRITSNISNHISFSKVTPEIINSNNSHNVNNQLVSISNWPKFDEILLEIGKKYDWKNDRWIKVKRKSKIPKENIHLHEKHNFRYRTVKLNRSKSRRNVVIAVTSVR